MGGCRWGAPPARPPDRGAFGVVERSAVVAVLEAFTALDVVGPRRAADGGVLRPLGATGSTATATTGAVGAAVDHPAQPGHDRPEQHDDDHAVADPGDRP